MTEAKKTNVFEAFIAASKKFKKPVFNKKVQYGKTNFAYADLAEILACIKEPLLEHGFVIMHEFDFKNDKQFILTYLQYKDGSGLGKVIFPIALEKQTMQDIGKQITYLKRYSLAALCSLAAEEDDDAKGIEGKELHQEKVKKHNKIQYLLKQLPHDRKMDFMGYIERTYNVWDITLIPENQVVTVEGMLEAELREQLNLSPKKYDLTREEK